MKISKKTFIAAVLGLVMIIGVASVYGSQNSYATLGTTSLSVDGGYINGGTGTLRGALFSSGGSVVVSARKVVAMWPDTTVSSFTTSSTSTQSLTGLNLDARENLFYVRVQRNSGAPHAWGQLTN